MYYEKCQARKKYLKIVRGLIHFGAIPFKVKIMGGIPVLAEII